MLWRSNLSIFKKNEYTLENIGDQNRYNPRHFLIPTDTEINSLKVGDTVRLIFKMSKSQNNGCRAERMWVTITKINNNKYVGTLNNQPYYLKTINAGDEISFLKENIATVLNHGISKFDENKFAIITKKALEKREINWIRKSEDIDNEQDSGWQLFYGDEDEAYLNNSSNSTIIALKNALSFEPLLEEPFNKGGTAYEYSKSKNAFIEVNEY